ncbi:MAG: amidohydrolase [Clostridiales Family XIII bacterium]|jgi:5-methylthioadenosine/S-adenosylhomocysteine deaminase|nr:amidohydrolase [Clostridiales Family XIII bacterium]
MLFSNVSVLNADFSVSEGMYVKTEGGVISYLSGEPPAGVAPAHRSGVLLMPAFYNAHTHSPMTLLRGRGENMNLQDWLEKKVFPFEDKLTGEDCYHATMLAMAESFSHGVVSSSDQYFFCDDILRAASESGAKMNISRGLSHFEDALDRSSFRPYLESRKLYYDNHDTVDGRIRVDLALHAEYTASQDLISAISDLSHETKAPVHVHISETQKEHEECKMRHGGQTPTEVFDAAGIWDFGGLAAHCVWAEECDAEILSNKGVTVVSCPVSNMKLASGIAPAPLFLDRGVNVALGTDGTASNNSLNFFEEIKLFSIGAKVRYGDPTLITSRQALYAATRAGALAQGRTDCGRLEQGARADFLVMDIGASSLNPVYDMADNLVYAGSSRDILMTVCDGTLVYKRGEGGAAEYPTIDLERVIFEVARAQKRILGSLPEETL